MSRILATPPPLPPGPMCGSPLGAVGSARARPSLSRDGSRVGDARHDSDALRLENQVLRARVQELERANQELRARLGEAPRAEAVPPPPAPYRASEQDSGANFERQPTEGCVCPNCRRTVPGANFEAHRIHCERNFGRCEACDEVLAVRDRAAHFANWTDKVRLCKAAYELDVKTLRIMRAHGAELDATVAEESGRTLLHFAAERGSLELASLALGIGEPGTPLLSNLDNKGQAALHLAASGGHAEVAAMLLEAHAEVDQRNGAGETALILACRQGCLDVIRLLTRAGADRQAKTALGDSAAQVAQAHSHLDCALFLGSCAAPPALSASVAPAPWAATAEVRHLAAVGGLPLRPLSRGGRLSAPVCA